MPLEPISFDLIDGSCLRCLLGLFVLDSILELTENGKKEQIRQFINMRGFFSCA